MASVIKLTSFLKNETDFTLALNCSATEQLVLLQNIQTIEVDRVSATLTDGSSAFVAASCLEEACSAGTGFNETALQPGATIALWLLCSSQDNMTALNITAGHMKYSIEFSFISLDEGAIVGIIVGSLVGLLILGVLLNFVEPHHIRKVFCCECRSNQTHVEHLDSVKDGGRDTALEGKAAAIKDGPSNDSDIEAAARSSSSSGLQEMNLTGQNLLLKEVPASKGSMLPDINRDKALAAQGWKDADNQQSLDS